jgi:hypothetical protein
VSVHARRALVRRVEREAAQEACKVALDRFLHLGLLYPLEKRDVEVARNKLVVVTFVLRPEAA